MPKRVVSVKLDVRNHRKYRVRTRREIKAFINASIAAKKHSRKGAPRLMRTIRKDRKYWLKPDAYMVIYKMAKMPKVTPIKQAIPTDDDLARDERFALKA